MRKIKEKHYLCDDFAITRARTYKIMCAKQQND